MSIEPVSESSQAPTVRRGAIGRTVQISELEPEDRVCVACMVFAFPVALIIVMVAVRMDGRFSFEAVLAFMVTFGLIYVIFNIIQAERREDGTDLVRILRSEEDLWIRRSIGDFVRVPLADLIRARTIVYGGHVRKLRIRLECRMPGGGLRQFDFIPHPRYRFDARDDNPLIAELMQSAERIRAMRRAHEVSGPAGEGVLLDLRSDVPAVAATVAPSVSGGGDTDAAGRDPSGHTQAHAAVPTDATRLSMNDRYMRLWYPLHWLWAPLLLVLLAAASPLFWPGKGEDLLGSAAVIALFQFFLFRRASADLVDAVVLDGDTLHYVRSGRPMRLPLADVVDISNYWTRYYLGHAPVSVRYVDGHSIVRISFIPRRDREWKSWWGLGEAMETLDSNVRRVHGRK